MLLYIKYRNPKSFHLVECNAPSLLFNTLSSRNDVIQFCVLKYYYYLCRRDVNAVISFGLNSTSAGTVDYTGGEGVRANLLESHSSTKPEAPKHSAWV